jgi:endonuclease/exonuclease/phosphatase (EEP) superfamily protein YafD
MGALAIRLIGLACGCLVIVTLAAVAARQYWLPELFSHFRVQYVTGMLPLLSIPLDHCLVSSALAVNAQRRGLSIESNHYPLFPEVAFR